MTTIQYYHNLVAKDDDETWNELDDLFYGTDFDDRVDDNIFGGF